MMKPLLKKRLRVALHAPLLLVALTALDASAERVCERPMSETGRTCTVEECIALQDEVNFLCKGDNEPPKCANLSPQDCQGLEEAKEAWRACQDARIEINFGCWGGGDPGHVAKVTEASLEIVTCNLIIALHCGNPCD